jgi:hypothetical protein
MRIEATFQRSGTVHFLRYWQTVTGMELGSVTLKINNQHTLAHAGGALYGTN